MATDFRKVSQVKLVTFCVPSSLSIFWDLTQGNRLPNSLIFDFHELGIAHFLMDRLSSDILSALRMEGHVKHRERAHLRVYRSLRGYKCT